VPRSSDPGSPAGATTPLDHFLSAPGLGTDCRSVAVTLPDGTTAAVGDAAAVHQPCAGRIINGVCVISL